MSNAPRSLLDSDNGRVGPDYFGYYSSEVVNLLSQEEDFFSVATGTSEVPQSKYGEGKQKNLVSYSDNSGPLYSNGVGAGFSDFKKDRLRLLLRQSVNTLSSEVDEVVDPVFAMHHLQNGLINKTHSLNHAATASASDDVVKIPCKKQKVSSSSSADSRKVTDDIQFLLENDNVEVEEMMKKNSDELSETLGYMEQQLELLLDAVMSKCRPMTLAEKQKLQKLIQKLPAGNLDRVAEIICRSRPAEEQSCDEIFVDLEKEDNATLWRLYYYVEAVEKAKSLPCNQES